MPPRKKKDLGDSDKVVEKMDEVNKALDLKLEDLEDIGPVRLKKLYANSIYTVDDLLNYGEESLCRMLEITWGDATKMITTAYESINKDAIFSNMIVKGGDLFKYRKEKIKYMTTGLPELDGIMRGGYETGVITEFFGAYGSGKTQIMIVACIMAQLPREKCCLSCGKLDTENSFGDRCLLKDNSEKVCNGKIWNGGGLSEFGKQCRVVYIDTENSFRPERMFEIVCNRELIKTKPQTKTEVKQDANKEPLNEEEYNKAFEFIDNVDVSKPPTTAFQMMIVRSLSSIIKGDLCKKCKKREINEEGLPTHQNHPKAKDDMKLQTHDFEKDKPATLVVIDSLISNYRKEFEGRGELSDRQTKLKSHIKHLVRTAESRNIVCLITNQIQESLGVMGDNIRPVGGNELAHTSTHRIYLMKPQSIKKDKITAILVDSPDNPKNEVKLELGSKGIQPQIE